jgi:hypothetical protein
MNYLTNLREVRIEGGVAIIKCLEGSGTQGDSFRIVTYVVESPRPNVTNTIATHDPDGVIYAVGQSFDGGEAR